ncbi:MAG: myo-inosose-2 dehydratase [Clostridiales bacterium]|nr:myo-inosose-2 dehydratase [Clostridiales bacterium]
MLNPEKVKLAIAPIGWTNDDMPDLGAENTFEQCISEMALAGFQGSEIGNKYPEDPAVLKPYLDIRGLQICNAWFSSLLTSEPYEVTIENFIRHRDKLHALGAKIIGASEQGNSIQGRLDVPILGEQKPVYTGEEWRLIAEGFNEMGRLAREKDMYFTVHHHMGTGVQTAEEIDRLMELTDPELVYLLFDSGHLSFAGIDPVPVLEKYVHRVKHVHLKDLRQDVYRSVVAQNMSFLDAVRAGVFTVPGDGDVDFAPIFAILEQSGYEGWVVVEAEQDPAKANPFAYAVKARRYIREQTSL